MRQPLQLTPWMQCYSVCLLDQQDDDNTDEFNFGVCQPVVVPTISYVVFLYSETSL